MTPPRKRPLEMTSGWDGFERGGDGDRCAPCEVRVSPTKSSNAR
jgi:hypothetical protein